MSQQVRNFIISEVRNKLGLITLNRPKQLNSLSAELLDEVLLELACWSKPASDGLSCVLVKGGGGKAFSAGGDVKALALAVKDKNLDYVSHQTRVRRLLLPLRIATQLTDKILKILNDYLRLLQNRQESFTIPLNRDGEGKP